MKKISVYTSPSPFSNHRVKKQVEFGCNLAEVVEQVIPENLVGHVEARVLVDGCIIPKELWRTVVPEIGQTINIRVVPMGGGKKNPLATILSIAVLIAAPYAGAALGASLGLGVTGAGVLTAGQTAFFSGIVRGAVSIVGVMLVNAVAPPPRPSNTGNVGNPAESPTLFIEGARNSINHYGVVPICLGRNRMFPLQAALPYTESQNNDNYIRQMFTYGYGQQLYISDLKIGETPLQNFSDYDIEHRLEGDLNLGTEIYSNDVFQLDQSVLLQQVDGYTLRTLQPQSDEAVIDVQFPSGLHTYNDAGRRQQRRVILELQYAEVGTENWSPAVGEFNQYAGRAFNIPHRNTNTTAQNRYSVFIDLRTGVLSLKTGNANQFPSAPTMSHVRIASIVATTQRVNGNLSTSISMSDVRPAAQFGLTLENSSSFVPTVTGAQQVTISAGGASVNDLDIYSSQAETLVRSVRIVFPQRGDYQIRIRRLTADTSSDRIQDRVFLSAIRSIRHQMPVRLQGINGTAIRIKASEQLNGALDQFNAVVSAVIPDYIPDLDTWEPAETSNPAAIYRYVLQGLANEQPLPDEKIDIEALQEWHQYCEERGYTCNIVIDYYAGVGEVLRLVASAGAATPAIVDGKWSVVVDRQKEDIVQMVTPRNSWGYSGEMIYPQIPHAFRVIFRNEEKGYVQDERIVYADGYDEENATLFEELELRHCTNADLAYKSARRYLATAILRPETHTFNMDVENLVFMRGDRIKFEHDVPLIGVGDGRIKSVYFDSVGNVSAVSLDDTIAIPTSGTYYMRIRFSDGTQIYKQLVSSVGEATFFEFAVPFPPEDAPMEGDLCYVTESGGELDLIVTRIEPMDNLTARITALNYSPEIFSAETGPIPQFDSNITLPLALLRPESPVLLDIQSDESVMIVNVDGTYTSRAVITLENENEGQIFTDVKIRRTGDISFTNANVLEATPERVILTGLDDGFRYDIWIRYRRAGGAVFSPPLQINNYRFIGTSGPPADVTGFVIDVAGESALLKWNANPDIDLSHYEIRFSSAFSGATWGTSQVLEQRVYENRVSVLFQPGTYLIKAVDQTGNYSINATAIITYDLGDLRNAVAILQEDPDFAGEKDNTGVIPAGLVIEDTTQGVGYYYFANHIYLDGIYNSIITSNLVVNGMRYNNLFTVQDIFAMQDIFGGIADNDIFAMQDIFGVEDIFGIGVDAWDARIEVRTTNDDPEESGVTWSEWLPLTAGNLEFRGAQFRVRLETFETGVTPFVTQLSVTVDMPDRIERGEDLIVGASGTTINFNPPFLSDPAVVITVQDGDANDEVQFISKDSEHFTFMVYNTTSETHVERTYDFIASGYGRRKDE